MTDTARTILITGVSSGLGRAFATAALDVGHTVVGTVRKEADAAGFTALHAERAHVRILDVTDDAEVRAAVDEVEQSVGPIDVLIANAGYGLEGTFEETPLADLRAQFDVNVFGAAATVQAVLPHMRARRRGHVLAVTSMGGLAGFPGVSAYCGSKYALEGILEAVGKEVAPFNIHVTAIEPGSFRTDWAGRSMIRTPRTIPDYDDLFEPIRAARRRAGGRQLGDPARAAAAVLYILDTPNPPAHLVLGSDALRLIRAGRDAVDHDLNTWEDLARSTDFPLEEEADDPPRSSTRRPPGSHVPGRSLNS
ncbi:oxidoreductase [Streptomyces anthocyanicus]|uniref:Oxidoreductase n=1 Tax=Streptomyces violaceolatus TaxID=67378 RepID=A0ABN3T8J5_9ACTN|nr:oxidoreductase [Streptomyces sp. ME02-6979A]MDX3348689.1 oxidoreductase [Streptomyces sp. ME02-6979A]